jgi:hypothetical protein
MVDLVERTETYFAAHSGLWRVGAWTMSSLALNGAGPPTPSTMRFSFPVSSGRAEAQRVRRSGTPVGPYVVLDVRVDRSVCPGCGWNPPAACDRTVAMDGTVDEGQFRTAFAGRAIVVTALPMGRSREIAEHVNAVEGRGDSALRTRAEYSALYAALLAEPGSLAASGRLRVRDDEGRHSAAGQAIEDCRAAAQSNPTVFDQAMYMVRVSGWPTEHMKPDKPVDAPANARLELYRADPADDRHIPPPTRAAYC